MRVTPKDTTPVKTWQQHFTSALRNTSDAANFFGQELPQVNYPLFIPLFFAEKIKHSAPLQNQFLPKIQENDQTQGLVDPIGDHINYKGNRLIHRYRNRALFLPTDICPIMCRYCFRKNELGTQDELFRQNNQDELSHYLNHHTEIEEIIFTGGDPLILSNEKIHMWLDFFSQFKHITMIRFHTRTPIILPQRIDRALINLLNHYQKRFPHMTLVIHSNHQDEISPEFRMASDQLRPLPLQLLSQSVLLKGVNDDPETLKNLFYELTKCGVRPYYLHHPDEARGAMHFYLPKQKGLEIYQQLKNMVPGWALPHYICDSPTGQGKILTSQSITNH